MQKLQTQDARTVSEANHGNFSTSSPIFTTMDPMSALSRFFASGMRAFFTIRRLDHANVNVYKDVLCSSKDCPIFYMRKKAQKDVEDVTAVLERFDGDDW
jgi:hypothetical protein